MSKSKKIKADFTPKAVPVEEKKPVIVVKTVPQTLKVMLTDSELQAIGHQMADARNKQIGWENDLKTITQQYKSKIQEQSAVVDTKSMLLIAKYDYREVACTEKYNYTTERVVIIRNDTGETVEDRKMTRSELEQLPMNLDETTNGKEAGHGVQS
jgi:hypothetical protein